MKRKFIMLLLPLIIFVCHCRPRETGKAVVRPYKRSQSVRVKQDLKTLKNAIKMYGEEKGYYPEELEDLVDEGYVTSVDPPQGKRYVYDSETGSLHAENITDESE